MRRLAQSRFVLTSARYVVSNNELTDPQLDFPQFDQARRPEMMSLAMPDDGLLGQFVPPADGLSGGVGMR